LPKRRRYWIPARIAFGSSDFVFFHWLHRRGEETGVYPLVLSRGLARVVTALYRRDVVEATLGSRRAPRPAALRVGAPRTLASAAGVFAAKAPLDRFRRAPHNP
jgi:hypothetical protein